MPPWVLYDSSYLHRACIVKLSLGARVQASQHIRPRAHGPASRISQQQQAPFPETYLSLTAHALPGSRQTQTSTAPSRTRSSHGSRVTTRSVSRAMCGPSRVHNESRRLWLACQTFQALSFCPELHNYQLYRGSVAGVLGRGAEDNPLSAGRAARGKPAS